MLRLLDGVARLPVLPRNPREKSTVFMRSKVKVNLRPSRAAFVCITDYPQPRAGEGARTEEFENKQIKCDTLMHVTEPLALMLHDVRTSYEVVVQRQAYQTY